MKTKTLAQHLKDPIVLAVVAARLTAAAYILKQPWWGWLLSFALDSFDYNIWVGLRKMTYAQYQTLDKIIDWSGYIIMQIYLMLNIADMRVAWLLFLHRVVGFIIFEKTGNNKMFILFPNLFEAYYLWAVLVGINGSYVWLGLLVGLKLLQEIHLHHWTFERLKRKNGFPKYMHRFGFAPINQVKNL